MTGHIILLVNQILISKTSLCKMYHKSISKPSLDSTLWTLTSMGTVSESNTRFGSGQENNR